MADNVAVTAGSGTTIAADDIGGVLHQRVKLALGADGVNDGDVASGNPLPISGTVDLGATDNAVLDSILAKIIAAPATEATLDSIKTAVELIDNAISGTEIQADIVAALPAGTNNIGDVDVATIAAGETHIGQVGTADTTITITCSLPTGALTAGDVMFDTQEIAAAARTSGGTVILQSVHVLDKDDQGAEFDLVFLNAATSIGTEDSAVSIADADAEDILGFVNIATTDYCDLVGSQVATKTGIGLMMTTSGSTSINVAGITRGTPTYSASGVLITFGFMQA